MHNNIIIKLLDNKNKFLKILLFNKIYYIPKNIYKNINFDNEIIINSKIIKTNSDFYNILKKELKLNIIRIKCETKIIPDNNTKIFIIDKFFKNINIYDKDGKDGKDGKENNNNDKNENKDKFFSIEIFHPLNGGNAINDIKNAFESIAQVFETFGKFLLFVIKMIIWVIRVLIWFAIEFLNPIKIFSDIFGSVTKITKIIIISGVDIISALLKYLFNIVFGYLFNGTLMGWDQETYKEEKEAKLKKRELEKELLGSESEAKSEFTNTEEKLHYDKDKCYKTPPGQIPFSIIIMSILCPPLGIFMQYGLSFWLNIIICCLLTMMYYIPGLLYTLILLYC